ncbi:MAG: C10 family peptidase [Alistipes sp.]|nr:C10 family peptidase [Alistipes sp.]
MVKKLLLSFSVMAVLSSCFKEFETPIYPEYGKEFESFESYVSFEQAISNADFVYKNIDVNHKRKIHDVGLITRSAISPATRSSEDDEPLAYVVNYSDNQGYAILAATDELPPVLALGDEGNFSMNNFVEYVSGSGTRTGNAILSPEQELQYEIVNNSLNLIVGPNINYGTYVDTAILMKCMPLVPVKWNQSAPYNMYAPKVGNVSCLAGCVPVACAQTLATLCYRHNFRPSVEINENYLVDWYTINNLICADTVKYASYQDTPGSRAVATLIRAIGEEIGAEYGVSSTSAYMSGVVELYEKLGLRNVRAKTISTPSTLDSLFLKIVDKNYPVDCCASRTTADGDVERHCFNVDGWLRLQYTHSSLEAVSDGGETIFREEKRQRMFDLLHINLGWGGSCDGYYLPGSFDLSSNEFGEYDEENDGSNTVQQIYDIAVAYYMFDL